MPPCRRKALATGEGLAGGQKAVTDFVTTFPRSHHLYDMQELLGTVLARQGKIAEAAAAYGSLAKGPPVIEVRAADAQIHIAGLPDFSDEERYPRTSQSRLLCVMGAVAT